MLEVLLVHALVEDPRVGEELAGEVAVQPLLELLLVEAAGHPRGGDPGGADDGEQRRQHQGEAGVERAAVPAHDAAPPWPAAAASGHSSGSQKR